MAYRAAAGVALMMNKTCAWAVGGRTLPFSHYTCDLADREGIRVAAPSQHAGPDTRRISTIGRPFIHHDFVFDNVRNYQSPLEDFAHESALVHIGFFGIQYLQSAIIEEACELTANMYPACPRKFDMRSIRETPWCEEAKPTLYMGIKK